MNKFFLRGSCAALAFGVVVSAQAGIFEGFSITADSALGSATAFIPISAMQHQAGGTEFSLYDTWNWSLRQPLDLVSSSGQLIGRIKAASNEYIGDPVITMAFSAIAGASTTHFTITSALLSFPAINGAQGQVSVGMSLTDSDQNGATLAGQFRDGKMYRAFYNGGAAAGSVFSSQIAGFSTGAGGSDVRSGIDGFRPVGAAVSDMQAQFDFSLSANDLASGTARYEVVVPEPAAFSAIGIGVLALMRRRSKK